MQSIEYHFLQDFTENRKKADRTEFGRDWLRNKHKFGLFSCGRKYPRRSAELKRLRMSSKERRLIGNLFLRQRMKIKIGSDHSKPFCIGRGVTQGCCLSPTIFNAYLEEVIKKVWTEPKE